MRPSAQHGERHLPDPARARARPRARPRSRPASRESPRTGSRRAPRSRPRARRARSRESTRPRARGPPPRGCARPPRRSSRRPLLDAVVVVRARSSRPTSAGSSVTMSRSRSSGEMSPCASISSPTQSMRSAQYARLKSTTGNSPIFLVWMSVSASHSSSMRPEAAGEDHEPLGRLHEHHLARVEVVEGEPDVAVRVQALLERAARC